MKSKLVQQMQSYVAETCIGASSIRKQGGSGLIQAARDYFRLLDLLAIPKETGRFNTWLDEHTDRLLLTFPDGARNFGAARKALNLFLRSSAYNCCLNKAFGLDAVLALLEVPVDSYAAKHLLHHDPTVAKNWIGLKKVTKDEHCKYQTAARVLATQWGIHRVDLDVFFFRRDAGSQ